MQAYFADMGVMENKGIKKAEKKPGCFRLQFPPREIQNVVRVRVMRGSSSSVQAQFPHL